MENVRSGQRSEEPTESSICKFFIEGKLYKHTSVNQFNLYNWGDKLEKTPSWQTIVVIENQPVS